MALLSSARLPLALWLLAASLASFLAGCSDEFCDIVECTSAQGGQGGSGGTGTTSSTGEGGTIDPGCIPAMLPAAAAVPPECGIFVDASANGDGKQATPLAKLDDAMTIAAMPGTPNAIYVCGSPELSGAFTMEGGGALFGGLVCGSWTYDPAANQPKITGVAGQPALSVTGAGSSLIEDFAIEAAPGMAEGQSSIGIFIRETNVSLARTSVAALDAGNGAAGQPAMGGGGQAAAGESLMIAGTSGAINMAYTCGGTTTTGGNGGNANTDGSAGQNNTMGGGAGGIAVSCDGKVGDSGGEGPGGTGLPDDSFGTLDITGFKPSTAPSGMPGLHGGGGGGGRGGSGAFMMSCGGAGGGAGGCGGPAGGGGQTGGASLAIAVLDGELILGAGVILTSGTGGTGGPGVAGGLGQSGGNAGTSCFDGCDGGPGGPGGLGGAGAGGNGGLSALVFLQGSMIQGMPAERTIGMGGALGPGGGGSAAGGSAGASCWLFTVDGAGPGGSCTM